MFITDKLVYVQLTKTGCTHIASILDRVVTGRQIGKHNRPNRNLIENKSRYFIGSIRDPWDWYVSLWSYGCEGKGTLFRRLTGRSISNHPFRIHPLLGLRSLLYEVGRETKLWEEAYSDRDNIDNFQRWLYMLCDSSYARDIGEGFADSNLSHFVGLLSFRYAQLYWRHPKLIYQSRINSTEEFLKMDREQNYTDYMIKTENIPQGIVECLNACRIEITSEKLMKIYTDQRTNSTQRSRDLGRYYNKISSDLVLNKEKAIVESYDYTPPL